MSSHNEQLQPTRFDPAPPPEPTKEESSAARDEGGAPAWVIPALLGLVVAAAIVVFWLPGKVSAPTVPEPALENTAPATQGTAAKKATPATEEASPWSDAQLAKLRKDAQDVLGELLDVQFRLEERSVGVWAEEAFATAKAAAETGDTQYKERMFIEAKASYEDALAQMLALEAGIPAAFDARIKEARLAIETGDAEAAAAALELAALIEPGDPRLAAMQTRLDNLPALLEQLATATDEEAVGDLAAAEATLRAATGLDPAHQRAASELERVAAAHNQQQFNDAMSDGYTALDESQFNTARKAFRKADSLQPGSTEAASAIQEVAAAETAAKLGRLQRQGSNYENDEKWQEAVKAYTAALDIGGNILFAREGLARSEPRARLHKQFQAAIDEPNRLSDTAVADTTEKLMQQANKLSPKGPVLSRQLSQLDTLLKLANTPIDVTLRSDLETEVIVYKVTRLGRFDQRQLELRPGSYTAVGTRTGYRDVRRNFEISHQNPIGPVTIICTEKI
ncbi:MAG: hypothetical protein ABJK20_13260 [Halieaceae bacterium]